MEVGCGWKCCTHYLFSPESEHAWLTKEQTYGKTAKVWEQFTMEGSRTCRVGNVKSLSLPVNKMLFHFLVGHSIINSLWLHGQILSNECDCNCTCV